MELFEKCALWERMRLPFALLTIVEAKGTVSRRSGRMAVSKDGEKAGTIGGGAHEAEAVEEAEFVLAQLSDIGAQLELPIVFDHERVSASNGRANNLSNAQASAIANAFCARIEAAGYQTMIYGNLRDLGRYNEDVTATREVWLAEYETHVPAARFPFSFWQYTDAGHINGINRNVDISIRFVPVETAQ